MRRMVGFPCVNVVGRLQLCDVVIGKGMLHCGCCPFTWSCSYLNE